MFELLGLNLYELMRNNKFRGLGLPAVRVLVSQASGRARAHADEGT